MSLLRMATPCKILSFCSNISNPILQKSPNLSPCQAFSKCNHLPTQFISFSSATHLSATHDDADTFRRWRPMCLYFTHGKCTKMDDPTHLEIFNHDCSWDLPVNGSDVIRKRPQKFDFFLILDLEGKAEILEFPVLIIDANTMAFVDLFHRFVRPSAMSEQRINDYIKIKYGKFGVDRVWHDMAIPFNEVIQEFEAWLAHHRLWENKSSGDLTQAAFVTCGDWDIKTQVPRQCSVSRIKLPQYFMKWINLKDVYQNFYKPQQEARGMRTMMQQLNIRMMGSHHLGIDDAKNIARVLQRLLADGAVLPVTASRDPRSLSDVRFLYK